MRISFLGAAVFFNGFFSKSALDPDRHVKVARAAGSAREVLPSAVTHRLRPAAPRPPPEHSSRGRSTGSWSRSDARHRAATPTSRRRALPRLNQRERSFWEGRGHRAALAAARTRARGSLARLSQRERALTRRWHTTTASALPFLPGQKSCVALITNTAACCPALLARTALVRLQ